MADITSVDLARMSGGNLEQASPDRRIGAGIVGSAECGEDLFPWRACIRRYRVAR